MAFTDFFIVVLCSVIIANIATSAQVKRSASVIDGAVATQTDEDICVVDPGLERRTILLEEAATTWGATLPPMLGRLGEIADSMQSPPVISTPTGRDCTELYNNGHTTNGVYRLGLNTQARQHFFAYCNMEDEDGGWTVLMRRFDGCTDFYRGWDAYVKGFGNLDDEHWMGLEHIYDLTSIGKYELHVELEAFDGTTAHAVYDSFRVCDEIDNYKLELGTYTGTAGDGLDVHRNQGFSTKDRDNDANTTENCAQSLTSAWWYTDCYRSNLNGEYLDNTPTSGTGIRWSEWVEKGAENLKSAEMKIRRVG